MSQEKKKLSQTQTKQNRSNFIQMIKQSKDCCYKDASNWERDKTVNYFRIKKLLLVKITYRNDIRLSTEKGVKSGVQVVYTVTAYGQCRVINATIATILTPFYQ